MPVSTSPRRAVRTKIPLGIRPRAAPSCFFCSLMACTCPERLPDEFLDVPHLALQPASRTLAIIDLDRTGDAFAIRPQRLEATANHVEDLVPLAFQRRAHGMQSIVKAALRHDFQAAGHVGGN